MVRLLRVISGSDQSPTVDFTDDVDWPDSSFQMIANNGQSGVGNVTIYDEDDVLPDFLLNKYLNSHNIVTFDDGPYRLFRGRIEQKETGRRERRGKRVKIINLITGDYNADLRGIVVHGFNRGVESNIDRFNALAAQYLAGSPRATTNLTTTYVSSSNALTIPAKDYSGQFVGDVMADIASDAGKIFFVTVDGQLFFDGAESTAYASGLRISDDLADDNGVTYPPIWDEGAAATESGMDQATRIRAYYGSDPSQSVTASLGTDAYYDYWEALWHDPFAETAANAQIRANYRLSELSSDSLTVACSIGPVQWGHLPLIKPGQTIQFKARGARGGRNADGTFTGDSFITLRIAELTWKTPSPDTYFASLKLSKPPKISPAGTGDPTRIIAQDALAGGPEATFTLGANIVTELAMLEEHSEVLGTWTTGLANFQAWSGCDLTLGLSSGCRPSPPETLWYRQSNYYAALRTTGSLPANSNYVGLELEIDMKSDQHAVGGHGGAPGLEAPVKGPHVVAAGFVGNTLTVGDIDGGVPVAVLHGNATTRTDIKIFIPSNYCPWGSGTRIVFTPQFRLFLNECCEGTINSLSSPAGDGSSRWGNPTLKPISLASGGWLTAGIIGTQNGINTSFTLVGGYTAVESVEVNGIAFNMQQVDLSAGSPNISFDGYAPLATDLVLVRYRAPAP